MIIDRHFIKMIVMIMVIITMDCRGQLHCVNKKLSYMRSKSAERFARKQEVLLLLFYDDMHNGVVVVDGDEVEDEHRAPQCSYGEVPRGAFSKIMEIRTVMLLLIMKTELRMNGKQEASYPKI